MLNILYSTPQISERIPFLFLPGVDGKDGSSGPSGNKGERGLSGRRGLAGPRGRRGNKRIYIFIVIRGQGGPPRVPIG